MKQAMLPGFVSPTEGRYRSALTAVVNAKGVLEVDTVKGCTLGMAAHKGGCYGLCYANQTARRYGLDFSHSVTRRLYPWNVRPVFAAVAGHHASWYRVGVAGDPSHDWEHTAQVCEFLAGTGKRPVIVTKHWKAADDDALAKLAAVGAVFNTSVSGMDTPGQLAYRRAQAERVRRYGMVSAYRVVTCQYGDTAWGVACDDRQCHLLALDHVIDNPLRIATNHPRVIAGDIQVTSCRESVGGGSKSVSLHREDVYLGTCGACPDQCGTKECA